MRICFTSDLHGRLVLYDQLTHVLRSSTPDLLILGGDLLVDGDIDDPLGTQGRWARQVFAPRLQAWKTIQPRLEIAVILGNHDWACTETVLRELAATGLLVVLGPQEVWRSGGAAFVGFSHTPPTPYWVKDYERLDMPGDAPPLTGGVVWDEASRTARQTTPEEHFGAESQALSVLLPRAMPSEPCVFVCHAPPHDTHLDRLPHVDYPVGSVAVRRWIEQHPPHVALHGHIHESPQVTGGILEELAGCPCINPGQTQDRLHAVTFELEKVRASLRHTVQA